MEYYDKIGFIGFGNMGQALGTGISSKGYEILYTDFEDKNIKNMRFCNVDEIINGCKYIILAIKPHQYEDFLNKYNLDNNIVISIAAGISSNFMTRLCKRYVLTMPNTPSTVKMGFTALVNNNTVNDMEFEAVNNIFSSVGITKIVKEEELANYICISGSSPAYFFNFIDSLSSGIEKLGVEKSLAEKTLAYVMKASAEMLLNSEETASQLCNNVCSPNGTTIQAIDIFKENKLDQICEDAIKNCFNRAKEMEIK